MVQKIGKNRKSKRNNSNNNNNDKKGGALREILKSWKTNSIDISEIVYSSETEKLDFLRNSVSIKKYTFTNYMLKYGHRNKITQKAAKSNICLNRRYICLWIAVLKNH